MIVLLAAHAGSGEHAQLVRRPSFGHFADEDRARAGANRQPRAGDLRPSRSVSVGAPSSISRATSPIVTAPLRSTTLVWLVPESLTVIEIAALRLMPLPPLIVLSSVSGIQVRIQIDRPFDRRRNAAEHVGARQVRLEQPLQIDIAPQHAFVAEVLDELAVVSVRLSLRPRAGKQVSALQLRVARGDERLAAPGRFAERRSAAPPGRPACRRRRAPRRECSISSCDVVPMLVSAALR